MLFNLCNCAAPLVSSGGPLCVGGAGFVTAVMATLAANARTREAKRLRGERPSGGRASNCCDEFAASHRLAPRLRSTPTMVDYIRDLRPAKWDSGVSVHG